MTLSDRAALCELAHRLGGLSIDRDKADFLAARLGPRLEALGLGDFGSYVRHLRSGRGAAEQVKFLEALTTHTTSFFRERVQYDWLRETGLPRLAADGCGRTQPLTVWSAACSSGQELYSALMTASEILGTAATADRLRGIGTDISQTILRRAERAIYSGAEIEGIPLPQRRAFLLRSREEPDTYRIVPELRAVASWRQANLVARASLPGDGVQVAFLRNVLIYFDPPTRDRVLRNVIERIAPGGYLMTGHSETVDAARYGLVALRPSIYHKDPR